MPSGSTIGRGETMSAARNKSGLSLSVSLLALLGGHSSPALAQSSLEVDQQSDASSAMEQDQAPQQDGPGAGEIVVTAQKREESVNRVGMSITALSGDTLANLGIVDAEQLVKVVPGLNYTRGAYGQPVFTVRGVGFNETSLAAAPTVSAYVDEIPLPYSLMTEGVGLDLERVEVLKGPQGTLFGQNSTGGAINFIAAKPTSHFEAGMDLGYGRFDAITASGFVSGPVSKTMRARLAVRQELSDAWQRSASRPNDRLGETDKTQARFLLDWTPTDRLALLLNVNGWRNQSDAQAGQFIGILNPRVPPIVAAQPNTGGSPRIADWDAGTEFAFDNDFWQVALRGDYELSDGLTLTSISAYSELGQNQYLDADGTPLQVFASRGIGSIESFSQEMRVAGEIGAEAQWLLGANYQYDKVKDASAPFVRDSSFPFDSADAVANNTVNTYSAFGSADWEFVPSLTLTAGLRYSWQDRAFEGCLYDTGDNSLAPLLAGVSTRLSGTPTSIPPGGCVTMSSVTFKPGVVVDSLNEGSLSWKAGLNWQVDPRKLLYALVSKGYKNGVFITTGATFDLSLAPATQESVIAYEAGFKLGLLGRTLQLNGAAFYYDYRDKQIRGRIIDPVVGPFNRILNVPESRSAGAELQISWEPTAGLTFNGGATYIDTKILGNFVNFTPSVTQKLLSGEPFPLTPKWQLTGDVHYDFPINETVSLFTGANGTYQGKTNAALGQEPLFDIKAYTVVDLRIGVRDQYDAWRVSAYVQNVGNTYYWTNVAAPSPDIAYRLAGRPRTYGLTASLRFQ